MIDPRMAEIGSNGLNILYERAAESRVRNLDTRMDSAISNGIQRALGHIEPTMFTKIVENPDNKKVVQHIVGPARFRRLCRAFDNAKKIFGVDVEKPIISRKIDADIQDYGSYKYTISLNRIDHGLIPSVLGTLGINTPHTNDDFNLDYVTNTETYAQIREHMQQTLKADWKITEVTNANNATRRLNFNRMVGGFILGGVASTALALNIEAPSVLMSYVYPAGAAAVGGWLSSMILPSVMDHPAKIHCEFSMLPLDPDTPHHYRGDPDLNLSANGNGGATIRPEVHADHMKTPQP